MNNRTTIPKGTHIQINGKSDFSRVSRSAHLMVFELRKDAVIEDGVQTMETVGGGNAIIDNPNGWPFSGVNHRINLAYDKIIISNNSEAMKRISLDTEY